MTQIFIVPKEGENIGDVIGVRGAGLGVVWQEFLAVACIATNGGELVFLPRGENSGRTAHNRSPHAKAQRVDFVDICNVASDIDLGQHAAIITRAAHQLHDFV